MKEGWAVYANRLQHYCVCEWIDLPSVKKGAGLSQQLREMEGKHILRQIDTSDHVVLLDEKGKEFNSVDFGGWISKKQNAGLRQTVFVIGGAFGFSEEILQRANEKISLSRMTFSHQMVRVFFAEQLYRAFTILRGEKYHHE